MLIYIHKEQALDDVERRYPADHYVLVDDKLRILRQSRGLGRARDDGVPAPGTMRTIRLALGAFPPADLTIERIGDLLDRP